MNNLNRLAEVLEELNIPTNVLLDWATCEFTRRAMNVGGGRLNNVDTNKVNALRALEVELSEQE